MSGSTIILGAVGEDKITGFEVYNTSQVASVFLTEILYVPLAKPVNEFDDCQFNPPSIEYSIDVPVAVTVIVPF